MEPLVWAGFILLIILFLALDLGVFHRRAHAQTVSEAIGWSVFWIALALAFNVLVHFLYEANWTGLGLAFPETVRGHTAALEFFTGYVLEKSLSVDNIFVIALIFAYFGVPLALQHRVLFWGVLGALAMRGVMIGAGAVLLDRFSWVTYVFGGVLILTAARMLVARHDNLEPERNPLVRVARRLFPVTADFEGARFCSRLDGRLAITPLMLVLLLVESTDLLFAVDSIPAVFAVTRDPFLVYTSNVFAILGLRSLYFVLAPMMARFRFLKFSLVFVLAFVGVKMLLTHHAPVPVAISLPVILGMLATGVLASLLWSERDTAPLASPVEEHLHHLLRVTREGAWQAIILILGGTLLVIGVAMIVLPGPALVVIPLALALLASEFLWARRLMARLMERAGRFRAGGGKDPHQGPRGDSARKQDTPG